MLSKTSLKVVRYTLHGFQIKKSYILFIFFKLIRLFWISYFNALNILIKAMVFFRASDSDQVASNAGLLIRIECL